MSPLDFLLIGSALLTGGMLVAASIRKMLSNYSLRRLPEAHRRAHIRLVEWLMRKNLIRTPGACLIDPVRPWAIGEAAGLLVLAAGTMATPNPAGFLGAFATAILFAACATWFAIRKASREALRSVQRDLPVACFLLSLLLESGMGASSALQETASSVPAGALSRELGELVRARSIGLSRGESIDQSRRRVPLEDYRIFLNHIHQGERLGIGLSKSLRGLSNKILENQDHRAETIAQQAAVKLLFPLVCFIFPAVFLIILSPVILDLWSRFLR
ncbi:MAG: type II secretion system F family protein [Thermodesulfobacteriota bacterium]